MTEQINIQWFPGHMAKAKRYIKDSLKLVDCVAEILDARVPLSSSNPDLRELCGTKPRIVLLNKSDLADKKTTEQWIKYYKDQGIGAFPVDCKSGSGINRFLPSVKDAISQKLERYAAKGMAGRTIRIMIAGIPNSGKSTLINKFAGEKRAKAENRPGVTRGRQWITTGGIEMLDTPGILWPKFEDPSVGEKLAFIGSIKEDILDTEQLSARLLEFLLRDYEPALRSRFKIDGEMPTDGYELLKLITQKRGLLISGGEPDTLRGSILILDEFRAGKLGRISLEKPL